MEDWLKYLVCFILGWIIARMIGEGFSVGGIPEKDKVDCSNKTVPPMGKECKTYNNNNP